MNRRLIELATRRGELKARMARERELIAENSMPVAALLDKADRVVEGVHWVKRHPREVAIGAFLLAVIRPRRAFRLARRGFFLWQTARALRGKVRAFV